MWAVRNILLPTDCSALAGHAASFARFLAERLGARLHVLHVSQPVLPPAPTPELAPFYTAPTPREAVLQQEMEAFVRRYLGSTWVPVVCSITTGLPAYAIPAYARDHAIDLIVIGTHARGVVRRLLLGSTSKTIMENAGCAVLMVPVTAAGGAGVPNEHEALPSIANEPKIGSY